MPRVKQQKMRLELNPNRLYEETVVYVNYDNRRVNRYDDEPTGGRFFVTLPPVVADALGQTEVRAETQEKALTAFKEMLEQFKKLKVERSKVILYDITVEPHPKADKSRYSSPTGYTVKVWAGTYEEMVTVSGTDIRRYSYEAVESSLTFPGEPFVLHQGQSKKYQRQVPWVEQNEAFFKWIADRMNELIVALAELEDPDKLIDTINAGKLLPLERSEGNAERR